PFDAGPRSLISLPCAGQPTPSSSLAQDVGLSRRERGFESRWGHPVSRGPRVSPADDDELVAVATGVNLAAHPSRLRDRVQAGLGARALADALEERVHVLERRIARLAHAGAEVE